MSTSKSEDIFQLPDILPLFPLQGALLLPRGELPLHIFEARYIQMINDVLRGHRMIGMIQPKSEQDDDLYTIGCAGKITAFEELEDGRFMVNITGVSRFQFSSMCQDSKAYQTAEVQWDQFENDLTPAECVDLDRDALKSLLVPYFEIQGLTCQTELIDLATDERLVTCLSMICPFSPIEKQALLEASCCKDRAGMFMAMLEMAVRQDVSKEQIQN